jgi:hypothetical protein
MSCQFLVVRIGASVALIQTLRSKLKLAQLRASAILLQLLMGGCKKLADKQNLREKTRPKSTRDFPKKISFNKQLYTYYFSIHGTYLGFATVLG